jgi:hypothetical protein
MVDIRLQQKRSGENNISIQFSYLAQTIKKWLSMIFEIDTKFLLANNITAHQYLLVKMASDGDYDGMKNYLHHSDTYIHLHSDMRKLFNAGLITRAPRDTDTFRDLKASDKFIKALSYTGDPFDEFYNIYPTKALRPDGSYDYLRVDRNRCRKMYHNIVRKNKILHDHIMECLRFEIDEKTATGSMGFFKRMHTWLSSESWKVTSERLEAGVKVTDVSTGGKEAYGEEFE